ncbi:hypothetical protein SprV_0702420500 [Sparganum proliferum]
MEASGKLRPFRWGGFLFAHLFCIMEKSHEEVAQVGGAPVVLENILACKKACKVTQPHRLVLNVHSGDVVEGGGVVGGCEDAFQHYSDASTADWSSSPQSDLYAGNRVGLWELLLAS